MPIDQTNIATEALPKPKGSKKSWKTTIAGVLSAIGLLSTQLGALLDENPETSLEWPVVMAALGALGIGWFSRDSDVSSQGKKV